MKYTELKITTEQGYLEPLEAALIEAGFTAMQIDDARDAADIAQHPELYKYDYLNEEIEARAREAGFEPGIDGGVTASDGSANGDADGAAAPDGSANGDADGAAIGAGFGDDACRPAPGGADEDGGAAPDGSAKSASGGADEDGGTAPNSSANAAAPVTITLYFAYDEEGRAGLKKAEALLGSLSAERISDACSETADARSARSDCNAKHASDACFETADARSARSGRNVEHAPDTEREKRGAVDAVCAGPALNISWSTEEAGDDSEWLYKWQEYFKPAKVGERIVVKPGWEEYEPAEGELVIEMDPGMAFGSGLHETTSMCIRALEKAIPELQAAKGGRKARAGETAKACANEAESSTGYEGEAAGTGTIDIGNVTQHGIKVLDVGTGTGILAIAAALLGADSCLGIDIDDEAVRVGRENVRRNGLSGMIGIDKGDLMEGIEYDADIIVANLMADLVIKLSPAAASQLKSGGIFITSGILDIKEEVCRTAVERAGFKISEVLSDGEWRAIVAIRR